ncbi:spore coat protein [Paenibacillus sp. ACRRX]|uniref:spore coat protein n=1 Tax=unclassified Paenibacillus TaxID=185978 RepID=UPI001EF49EAC|nr:MULTISPECIES: spore coat protein [unclassified Paenibacillus]MCG7407356.1 spore coat protein [Paenibacillus sp. ACRRX]MDK8180582.1 spore coat protein [Paenibacillus sp. UMB4589-SE434]
MSCQDKHEKKHKKCNDDHKKHYHWSALEHCCHPLDHSTVNQDADQIIENVQASYEEVIIKDSCDVNVTTTDTKIAASLQASLQAALVVVISISIGSSTRAESIVNDLLQKIDVKQTNRQRVVIQNSKGVVVSTTDSFVSVNIQVLLQILLALVIQIDVL